MPRQSAVDAARAPFLGALADVVGREEPARLGAGQLRLRRARWRDGSARRVPEYFIWSPKCGAARARSALLPAMSTIGDRRSAAAMSTRVIGDDLVIAAERADEADIGRRGQSDHAYACARVCSRWASPNAVLLEALESSTLRAPKNVVLGEEVVDQERQHEQRPQQRLVVALPAGESGIAADARIGVVDRRHALPMRGPSRKPRLLTSAASMTRCVAIGK